MAVLVIAEHNHAALNPAVYSLVTAAQKIGGDIDIRIAAQEGGKLAEEAAKINGILCRRTARKSCRFRLRSGKRI